MTQKVVTVFGATGNQGGSVVTAILEHPKLASKYKIRAITRDPSKPNAQALASKGAELAKADLNDVQSVKKAIAGSYGVFAVTNYWETMSKSTEFQQGKNIVDACKEEGVQHLVWSGLPNVTKMTHGKLSKVEHFDSKAEVAEYAEKVKGDMLTTYFMPAYFMSNLPGQVRPGPDGVPTLSMSWHPTHTHLPMIDIRTDTGKFVAGILEAGSAANGVHVQGVSQWVVPRQIINDLSEVTGREIRYHQTPADVESAAKLDKIGEELLQNMILIRDYSYFGQGSEKKQAESDKFFLEGEKKTTWKEFAQAAGL